MIRDSYPRAMRFFKVALLNAGLEEVEEAQKYIDTVLRLQENQGNFVKPLSPFFMTGIVEKMDKKSEANDSQPPVQENTSLLSKENVIFVDGATLPI